MTAFLMRCCVMVARQTLTLFVWVRILVGQPLFMAAFAAIFVLEVWLSLVERCVRDAEAASSSLVTSTMQSALIGFEYPVTGTLFFCSQIVLQSGQC